MPKVYIDTNVFIAAREFEVLPAALLELFDLAGAGGDLGLATSEITLPELIAKPLADDRHDLVEAYDRWLVPSAWLDVLPVSRPVLWNAGILRSAYPGVKLPDAIHLSTALATGCTFFLTADTGLKGRYELSPSRHNPAAAQSDVEVIRPEERALRKLLAGNGS